MSAADITEARCTTCGESRVELFDGKQQLAWRCPNCCEVTPIEETA